MKLGIMKRIKKTKIEFCRFSGEMNKTGEIRIKPIGKAKNNILKPTLAGWKNIITNIVIEKRYTKGLDGIEGYSHIIVVYWMDKEKECHLKHHPQGRADIPFIGIFACRCPQRPNRIAISTVKLLSRKGNVLKVKDLDIVNGTAVLDIKPYTPRYDKVEKTRVPKWVGKLVL